MLMFLDTNLDSENMSGVPLSAPETTNPEG